MEDDEERTEDGAEAGHETPKDQGEKTYHGGEGDVVAAEPAVEHDPMVTTGAGAGRSEAAGNDAETRPLESREQSAADEKRVQTRGGDDPDEGGRYASETERPEEPAYVAQNEREECEHAEEQEGGVQRGDRAMEGSEIMASDDLCSVFVRQPKGMVPGRNTKQLSAPVSCGGMGLHQMYWAYWWRFITTMQQTIRHHHQAFRVSLNASVERT